MSKNSRRNLFPILDKGKIFHRDTQPKSNIKNLLESFENSTISPMQRYKLLTKKLDDKTQDCVRDNSLKKDLPQVFTFPKAPR